MQAVVAAVTAATATAAVRTIFYGCSFHSSRTQHFMFRAPVHYQCLWVSHPICAHMAHWPRIFHFKMPFSIHYVSIFNICGCCCCCTITTDINQKRMFESLLWTSIRTDVAFLWGGNSKYVKWEYISEFATARTSHSEKKSPHHRLKINWIGVVEMERSFSIIRNLTETLLLLLRSPLINLLFWFALAKLKLTFRQHSQWCCIESIATHSMLNTKWKLPKWTNVLCKLWSHLCKCERREFIEWVMWRPIDSFTPKYDQQKKKKKNGNIAEKNEPGFCASKFVLDPFGFIKSVDLLTWSTVSDDAVISIECFRSILSTLNLLLFSLSLSLNLFGGTCERVRVGQSIGWPNANKTIDLR